MIHYTLHESESVLHVRPAGPLEERDFEELARAVDPHIERTGGLRGLVVETAEFPGWADPRAFASHIRFVRDHHRRIEKVAFVTDSPVGEIADSVAEHFVAAEIRTFPFGVTDEARAWVRADGESRDSLQREEA